MKQFALPIFFCLSFIALAAGQQRKIAFERGDSVWIANLDGTAATKIAEGSCPDISPDGARLAFNTNENQIVQPGRPPASPIRHIAFADSATGKVTIFKDILSDNCFGPVWSPDSSKLAFQIFVNDEWHLGWINADGSDFRLLKDVKPRNETFITSIDTVWAPAWSSDGRSIFCHDMDEIYEIDLDGNVLKKWELSTLQDQGNLSSDSRLSVSSDGRRLLVSLDVRHAGKAWMGAQRAVYVFDLATKIITRVSGEHDSVWNACWLTRDEFLCSLLKEHEEQLSIYWMSVNGNNSKLVTKEAGAPSVSAR